MKISGKMVIFPGGYGQIGVHRFTFKTVKLCEKEESGNKKEISKGGVEIFGKNEEILISFL